jgi:DNA-directed RNA polymerase subunit RPC12/RpoP
MNSFAKYPDIATLWSDQNELTADEVRPNHRSGAWTCPTCHNDYNAEIIDMVNGDGDCPYCNDRMVAPGYNTLAAKFPDIAALWSDKNELSADEVLPNTNFADWDCPDCHMTFHARIIDMVNGNDNCPYCSGRKAIPGKTSFAALHPDLIEEWDYIANYCLIDPDEITDSCTQKVWWICQKNPRHHYLLSPSEKLLYQKRHRESCLYCKGRRRKKTYF